MHMTTVPYRKFVNDLCRRQTEGPVFQGEGGFPEEGGLPGRVSSVGGDGREIEALVVGTGDDLRGQDLVLGADDGAELARTVIGRGDPLGKGSLGAGRGLDNPIHAVGIPVEPDKGTDAGKLVGQGHLERIRDPGGFRTADLAGPVSAIMMGRELICFNVE